MSKRINWDAIGITTSVACAIHCAILPLFLASLPLFGIDIIENHAFEYGMIFLALIIGVYSLWHGYKKHHHSYLPLVIFILGMVFLFLKQLWHDLHLYLLVPAVVFIIAAHYVNYKLCRKHNHAHADDCSHEHY